MIYYYHELNVGGDYHGDYRQYHIAESREEA